MHYIEHEINEKTFCPKMEMPALGQSLSKSTKHSKSSSLQPQPHLS